MELLDRNGLDRSPAWERLDSIIWSRWHCLGGPLLFQVFVFLCCLLQKLLSFLMFFFFNGHKCTSKENVVFARYHGLNLFGLWLKLSPSSLPQFQNCMAGVRPLLVSLFTFFLFLFCGFLLLEWVGAEMGHWLMLHSSTPLKHLPPTSVNCRI